MQFFDASGTLNMDFWVNGPASKNVARSLYMGIVAPPGAAYQFSTNTAVLPTATWVYLGATYSKCKDVTLQLTFITRITAFSGL